MPDPGVQRLLNEADRARKDRQRMIRDLESQAKALERQLHDAKRLPDTGRLQVQLANSAKECRRRIDQVKRDIKVIERQISDLKRMR